MCKELGVSIVAYNPLAAGMLTGKQQRDRPAPGTRFDLVPMHRDRFWHAAYFDAVEELRGVAERAGRRMVDLSLSWLLHHTTTDCIVLGASNPEQLTENLDAFERGPLGEDVVAACDVVWQKLRGITPKYNR
jgi:aryl-alcohol dehydrogenase-like predicted oxidoreductase